MVKVFKPKGAVSKKMAAKIANKNNKNGSTAKRKKNMKNPANFPSAVSTINTAPVAIGNSVKGSKSIIHPSKNGGVQIIGRDFMFAPVGTGSVLTWTSTGGTPITPAAFGDSTLRQMVQMYQEFKVNSICVHYITSSATSSNGDVMFYFSKNRESVFLNQTSANLLPFVLSDEDTIIGPQWTNHSACLHVTSTWKSCDYGMSSVVSDFSDGEVFLLSKTSTTDSPGYVLFDYDISFREHSIAPRLLTYPITRIQYFQTSMGFAGTSAAGAPVGLIVGAGPTALNISGTTAVSPNGLQAGDVYKIIIDLTNSVVANWLLPTTIQPIRLPLANTFVTTPLVDGFTCYAAYNGITWQLYANSESAFVQTNEFEYNATNVNASINLQVWLSFIGQVGAVNLVPNF